MIRFIFKRLLSAIPLLLGVAFLSFLFVHLAPGDYFDALKTNPQISSETIERYRSQYHLDQSFFIQFWYWLGNMARGDLGYSFVQKAPVIEIILRRLWPTLLLALVSLTVVWIVAVPLGVLSAVRHNSRIDRTISFCALLGVSIPSFILAIMLLALSSWIPGMPIGGMTSLHFADLPWYAKIGDLLVHLIVPALAIGILSTGSLLRLTRANMLDVLRKPFITTARAYGLSESTVRKQAFFNAVNPLITMLGYEFAGLLSGSAIIEIICNWPGIGSVMLEAVMSQDLFLVMGGIMMGGVLLIIGNLIADILLYLVDPRVQLS